MAAEPTPAERFEALAKRLLAVPKAELDEKRKAREATKKRRKPSGE
jgi:hypothetical protein